MRKEGMEGKVEGRGRDVPNLVSLKIFGDKATTSPEKEVTLLPCPCSPVPKIFFGSAKTFP
jgi:hypothetical protein